MTSLQSGKVGTLASCSWPTPLSAKYRWGFKVEDCTYRTLSDWDTGRKEKQESQGNSCPCLPEITGHNKGGRDPAGAEDIIELRRMWQVAIMISLEWEEYNFIPHKPVISIVLSHISYANWPKHEWCKCWFHCTI